MRAAATGALPRHRQGHSRLRSTWLQRQRWRLPLKASRRSPPEEGPTPRRRCRPLWYTRQPRSAAPAAAAAAAARARSCRRQLLLRGCCRRVPRRQVGSWAAPSHDPSHARASSTRGVRLRGGPPLRMELRRLLRCCHCITAMGLGRLLRSPAAAAAAWAKKAPAASPTAQGASLATPRRFRWGSHTGRPQLAAVASPCTHGTGGVAPVRRPRPRASCCSSHGACLRSTLTVALGAATWPAATPGTLGRRWGAALRFRQVAPCPCPHPWLHQAHKGRTRNK